MPIATARAVKLLLAACAWVSAAPACAQVYFGAGAGVQFTQGGAGQVAASVSSGVEAHYAAWTDNETGQALGVGYRLSGPGPVSLVFGAAYVPRITENLLHHANAYVELRWTLSRHFSCQASQLFRSWTRPRRKLIAVRRALAPA